jgi:Na+-driven multidrug efflux pump
VVGTCYALRPVAILVFYLMKPSVFSAYFFLVFLGLIGNSTVPPTTNLISKLYGVKKVGLLLGTAFVFPVLLLGLLWRWELDGIWFNFVGVNALAAVLSVILLRRLAREIRKKEEEKQTENKTAAP